MSETRVRHQYAPTRYTKVYFWEYVAGGRSMSGKAARGVTCFLLVHRFPLQFSLMGF